MNRRDFLAAGTGVAILTALGAPATRAAEATHRMKRVSGFSLGDGFSADQRRLLTDALGVFYERFLQRHFLSVPELEDGRSGARLLPKFDTSDFAPGQNPATYLGSQLARMRTFCLGDRPAHPFARVNLRYDYNDRAGYAANAFKAEQQVRVRAGLGAGPLFVGEFNININAYFLGDGGKGKHNVDPVYWGAVIAHEAVHNLGHDHPPSRADKDYYLHQVVLVDMSVMTDGRVKYGDKIQTPVLCARPAS